MKKKLMALFLAMVMIMGLSATAFAAEGDENGETTTVTEVSASVDTEFTFTKTYTDTKGDALPDGIFPHETLTFTVTEDGGNPDKTVPSITDTSVDSNPDTISIIIPAYTTVGKYNYTVAEEAGNTQGVTYNTNSFGIQVMVYYGSDGQLKKEVTFTTSDGGQGKIDGIVNQYAVSEGGDDNHGLTVTKKVTGNLGSTKTAFEMTVTFTSEKPVASAISYNNAGAVGSVATTDWTKGANGTYTATATINLKDGASATFDYIPAGVKYSVEEDAKYQVADANGSNPEAGYTVDYDTAQEGEVEEGSTASTIVTNDKGTTVDTGITMDSLPYTMLLALVVMAGVAFFSKNRMTRED